jgi:mono/diheme cytochrome c family protein
LIVVAGGIVATAIFVLWPTRTRVVNSNVPRDAVLVAQGRYVAAAADCAGCHSAPGRPPYSGGLGLASPIGIIHSTNITPDRESGIGGWTLDEFDRAVRHGMNRKGVSLYPAMPYPSYARMTDTDLIALYAYLMRGVEPVALAKPDNEIPWPLSMRWPLAIWRKVFGPRDTQPMFDGERYADASIARGAYLVQGPGHCGSCHTPRARTLQEKALDDSSDVFLSGGPVIDGWVAVSLRGEAAEGLGGWTEEDIVRTLRSARNERHAVIGSPMQDAITHGTQDLTDKDLLAIARYLKTLPPRPGASATPAPKADPAAARSLDPTAQALDPTARLLAAGREPSRGAQLFVDNCAACHRTSGEGAAGVFPAMARNSSVLSPNPESLVRLILEGSSLPPTRTAPSALGMPGFGWRMSDEEVAELATFVRQSFGNEAGSVSSKSVRRVRDRK